MNGTRPAIIAVIAVLTLAALFLQDGDVRADPVGDPQGDTFGVGSVQLDISEINAVFTSTTLTLTVRFYTPIKPPWDGASNSVVALIPMDTDQNESTGDFGFDFCLRLVGFVTPGTVEILDCESVAVVGSAPVSFTATSFTTTFSLALISDNGLLDYGVLVGTVDSFGGLDEFTDVAPNAGLATSQPACPPLPPGSTFCDVAADHWAHPFIEATVDAGITAGCSPSPPLYCPDQSVTRAQMAVFIILALNDAPVTPTGVFDDVPTSHFAAGFIERLAELGITSGCGGGNYCPNDPVTRAQMAVFIVVAFNLLPP